MKLQICIGLLLSSSVAVAQHPLDFVPQDALAVVSVKNGDAINSTLKSINEQAKLPAAAPNAIELSQFFENPSAVDNASEVLIILAPTKLAEGEKPAGMFGPMPHMMVVCKEESGQTLKLNEYGGLKTSTNVDGWFIGTGASSWEPSSGTTLAPILADLPKAQVAGILDFAALWKQFGPVGQMMGGMAIGSMNRPGSDGVVSPERRKATAAASKGFKEVTKWCGAVKDISVGLNFDRYTLIADIDVRMKEGKTLSIDNSSLLEMSKLPTDSMLQYAMSGEMTRKLVNMDLGLLQELAPGNDPYPIFMTTQLEAMVDSIQDNVIAYGLDSNIGLTSTTLTDVEDQDTYLEQMYEIMNEMTGILLNEFNLQVTTSNTPLTWNIKSLATDETVKNLMVAIFPEDSQLRFSKYGSNRVLMGMGPKDWKPIGRARSTPISEIMEEYSDSVDIDFASSFDARSLAVGFTQIVQKVDPEENLHIGTTPPARSSLLFGTTESGTFIELRSDLLGVATLVAELDKLE